MSCANRPIIVVIAILALLSACGGGGGGGGVGASQPPPNNTIPPPLALNYPADFPLGSQSIDKIRTYTVNGVTAAKAYDFVLSNASSDLGISVLNLTNPSGPVCTKFTTAGTDSCTGTPTVGSVMITVSNFTDAAQTYTLDIQASNSLPTLNQGSTTNPFTLDSASQLPYTGTVAPLGNSYYRVSNLVPGDRYRVAITNASDPDLDLGAFRDAFVTGAACDPEYLTDQRCIFVSQDDSVALHVDGTFAFSGASFDIEVTRLSTADQFEGAWYQAHALDAAAGDTAHLGKVDDYNSHYRLTGLTPGRTYTVELTSKTVGSRLAYYDPATGNAIAGECNPDTRSLNSSAAGGCTFKAARQDVYLKVSANSGANAAGGGRYILKLKHEAAAQGSAAEPVRLSFAGPIFRHPATVDNSASYYHVSGLSPGTDYLVRMAGNGFGQRLTVYDGDSSFSNPAVCAVANDGYCQLTAASADFYIKVNGPSTPPGGTYSLNIAPTTANETITDISAAALPQAGRVHDYFSNYTITGLAADTLYIAKLTAAIGWFQVAASNVDSGVQGCSFVTRDTGGCLLRTGPGGNLKFSVGNASFSDNNDPGGHFNLNVAPAPVLTSAHVATDVPLVIPDNDATGVTSSMLVSGSTVNAIGDISVEVIVQHGYTADLVLRLIAPDGSAIPLAEHLGGGEYVNTRFNDYAATKINNGDAARYNLSFRPAAPLHVLNGMNANGTWRLQVADDRNSNRTDALGGTLLGWGLSFR